MKNIAFQPELRPALPIILAYNFELVKEGVVTNGARVFQPVYENGLENPFTVYFAPPPRPRPRFMQKLPTRFFAVHREARLSIT